MEWPELPDHLWACPKCNQRGVYGNNSNGGLLHSGSSVAALYAGGVPGVFCWVRFCMLYGLVLHVVLCTLVCVYTGMLYCVLMHGIW